MSVVNQETGTTIDEIADGIHRISTPVPPSDALPPGFTFNQYLIVDDSVFLMSRLTNAARSTTFWKWPRRLSLCAAKLLPWCLLAIWLTGRPVQWPTAKL
jgi:hypothetical protein